MAKSPAAILYGSDGIEKGTASVPVRTDPTGTTAQPVSDAGGSLTIDAVSLPLPTGAATETTLDLVRAKTDNLDVALSTRALETGGNLATAATKLTTIDGHVDVNLSTRATEATLLAADGRLTTIDAVLDAIKDTDGVKKITDPLPAGTNILGQVKITDGDEIAQVTADGRLRVDPSAIVTGQGIVNSYLFNGASAEMAINGGGGTVFSWSPGASHDVEGISLSFIIEDATIYFGDNWGGISALANGVLIEAKADDVAYTIGNLKRTRELFQLCAPGGFDVYAATPDCAKGEILISGLLFRKDGTFVNDDYVRVTIRDNLTGLTHQSCLFKGKEID